ncbi:polymorphic toxin-type HINT domain-containing protein [Streptomyces sp. NPDC091263]|uniref:polymorphic toxin-type HINT domain-containing protein n=1 Tax=Streptomyces sp. NPDC091263 TaxID=3155194 RepID=UPI00344CF011
MEPLLAHRAGVRRSDTIQTVDTSWRTLRTETEFDTTYGLPTQVENSVVRPDGTGGETVSEQRCSRSAYVHNTDAWIIGTVKEARTTATPCSGYSTADPATQLISSVRTFYDSLAYGATPVRNLPTTTCTINAAGTDHSICTSVTYDPLGRARKLAKPGQGTTETQYTPADTGGPVTSVKTINAKSHASTTTFDPGRSLPLTVTDANGKVTRSVYDSLGRLTEGYGTERSSGTTPDTKVSYKAATATSSGTTPAAVTVRNLKDDGTYAVSTALYDGLGREAQTQTEAHGAGRIITDTHYNDHGLVDRRTSGYLAKGEPTTDPFRVKSTSLIPSWLKYRYDGMERTVRESTYLGGEFAYATYTSFTDTATFVDPPGSTAPRASVTTDAWGRMSSVQHYTGADNSKSRETEYAYDSRGYLKSVTDPAGNSWTYTYDSRGRITTKNDPDTGTSHIEYDDADREVKTVDALKKTLLTTYDTLSRITAVREGLATNAPVKEFTFDRTGALGLPYESIRHSSGGDYTNRVTGYDAAYRPTSSEVVIPANAATTGLSGTYGYAYTYTPTGQPESVTLPAKGGLAKEKVVTRYNEDGLPESTSGLAWYTADVTYSPYGDILRTVTGAQPYRLWTTNFYDQQNGRLLRTVADRETAAPHRVSDSYYSYDESGTITSQARKLSDATTSVWDTQCYTYDVLGQMVSAWTSNIAPDGKGTGCKATSGSTWGHRADGNPSTGPLADAADSEADTSGSPDTSLTSTLDAAQPATGTVATTGATAYRQAFTYDLVGNRATQTDYDITDPAKQSTRTFAYGTVVTGNGTSPATTTQPHILSSISSNPAGQGATFTSGSTGNTELRDLPTTTQNLTWDSENKLDTITDDGVKTTYTYDAAGNRLLENSPSGSTLHLGETELTTDSTGKITRASRTYSHPGAPSVTRTASNGATTGHRQNALITDHLGTANTSIEIGANQPVTRRAFKPYGELRGTKPSNWPNRRSFLGTGIDDATTGLTHIGAREYDQSTGRFLSADPLIDNTDPLQMNGYSYAKNSPISTSDPDGLRPLTPCERGCSDGDNSRRDWMTSNGDGTWSYHWEYSTYVYNGENKLASVIKTGSDQPLPRKIVYKPLDIKIQTAVIKFIAGVVLPDPTAWKDCLSGSGVGSCLVAGMDLPFAKALKMVPDAVVKKGAEAAGKWLEKTLDRLKGCKKCFLAGTHVKMADGGNKKIEEIKAGDEVLATDPKTGETGPRKVTRLIVTDNDKQFNELTINTPDGPEQLTATNEHPFWVPDLGQWVEARNLRPGTTLRTDTGTTVTVKANRSYGARARTYNLTVDDLHTYYVLAGTTPVLVHNSTCLTSAIHDDPLLVKAAKKAGKNEDAQADLDAMQKRLGEGNMNPGLGNGSLPGTGISYARSRNGARLFFRNTESGVQIVGKSSKANEDAVIARLKRIYGQ